jgi:hypothetical protein
VTIATASCHGPGFVVTVDAMSVYFACFSGVYQVTPK